MVVSNAVAALSDISEASTSGRSMLDMSPSSLNKMLTALNECSEWGQGGNSIDARSDHHGLLKGNVKTLLKTKLHTAKMNGAWNGFRIARKVFILDALSSNYAPRDEREAQAVCERIVPRLAHANPAVVLSSVKLLMKFMEALCQVRRIQSFMNYKHECKTSCHIQEKRTTQHFCMMEFETD